MGNGGQTIDSLGVGGWKSALYFAQFLCKDWALGKIYLIGEVHHSMV